MQFNSIDFLFYFLPIFLMVYYILPDRLRNFVLIIGSLAFYAQAGSNKPLIMGLLIGSTLVTFFIAWLLEKVRSGWLLAFSLCAMAGVLMFFKLYNEGRLLPAGLSFYLFQLAAYLICVYRQQIHADRNILAFGAQTVMFPKLLSGPLMEPASLQEQVKKPNISMQNIHDGLQQLIRCGFCRTVMACRSAIK